MFASSRCCASRMAMNAATPGGSNDATTRSTTILAGSGQSMKRTNVFIRPSSCRRETGASGRSSSPLPCYAPVAIVRSEADPTQRFRLLMWSELN